MEVLIWAVGFIDAFRTTFPSVSLTFGYLAFVVAVIGFANHSRNRWEDLKIQLAGDEPRGHIKIIAMDQAEADFHNWYGALILVSNIAETGLVLMWVSLLSFQKWNGLVELGLVTLAVLLCHILSVSTYKKEAKEILGHSKTYRWFFPFSVVLAGKP